ncbi:MAG: hypothetical protein FWC78_08575 [Defluviitaleaceae bacterium]|nr:hypothetical protein [Defluviitaleaceae bacterium]
MDALLDLLDEIEEVLEKSKSLPFSNKISVEKERILDVLNEIRLSMPDDIRHAQRIISDRDKILAEAEHDANGILEIAESDAQLKTSQHEIFRRASDEATKIIDIAKSDAREMRLNAIDYADEQLEKAEGKLREYMQNLDTQHKKIMNYYSDLLDVIYSNREELRGR